MSRKYADFECQKCGLEIKDLLIDAKRCPFCGRARGFKRLFNTVQISTRGHRAAKFIDRRLQPAYDAKSKKENSFEKDGNAALEKAWELAPTEQREAAVAANGGKKPEAKMQMHSVPAGSAMGMIDPQARRDTREMVWPMVNRRVVPQYQR